MDSFILCIQHKWILFPRYIYCKKEHHHTCLLRYTTGHLRYWLGCLAQLLHFHQHKCNQMRAYYYDAQPSGNHGTRLSIPRDNRTSQGSSSWHLEFEHDTQHKEGRNYGDYPERDWDRVIRILKRTQRQCSGNHFCIVCISDFQAYTDGYLLHLDVYSVHPQLHLFIRLIDQRLRAYCKIWIMNQILELNSSRIRKTLTIPSVLAYLVFKIFESFIFTILLRFEQRPLW